MTKSINEIKKEFEQADRQSLLSLYETYRDDNRAGVVSLIAKNKKRIVLKKCVFMKENTRIFNISVELMKWEEDHLLGQ